MLRYRTLYLALGAAVAMTACSDSGRQVSAPPAVRASLSAGSIGTIVLQTNAGSGGNVAAAVSGTQFVFASLTPAGGSSFSEFNVWPSPFGAPSVAISGSPCCAADANLGGDVAGGGGVWLHAGGSWSFTLLSLGSYAAAVNFGVNDARESVGMVLQSGVAWMAAYWSDPTAVPVLLPVPLTSGTLVSVNARAINNTGQIVGWLRESTTSGRKTTERNRAIVWTRSGTTWLAALLPDDGTTSFATDINDAGQIAGATANLTIWTPTGSGYSSTTVIATGNGYFPRIDACGRVASTRLAQGKREAFVVENGTLTVLPKPAASTMARDISSDPLTRQSVIAGGYQGGSSAWMPVAWTLPAC
jgi:hypothetical protein